MTQTGDRTLTWIGLFESKYAIADVRPHLVAQLYKFRELLEEISPELGLTDPSSGEVIWSN
tara:strand:- start:482 stop:664 length:183 start_codon:yes stop_codon:yes gene_type:complete